MTNWPAGEFHVCHPALPAQGYRLVAQGYTSPQIARQILVSVKTVETYRSRLAQKLGLRTRSDVIRFAVQMGLLTPEILEAEEGRPAR